MKLKRLLTFLLVFCLALNTLAGTLMFSASALGTLTHEKGYVLAETSKELSKSSLSFSFGETTLSGADVTITPVGTNSDKVTVGADSITASEKGVYTLQITYNSETITVYLLVKDKSDKEYVLYSSDFGEVANGELPEGFVNPSNNKSRVFVKDGKLIVDSIGVSGKLSGVGVTGSVSVLLPEFLKNFPDVIIKSNIAFEQVANSGRWCSTMYRYKDQDHFYHMSYRQSGAEVECTRLEGTNNWLKDATTVTPYSVIPLGQNVRSTIEIKGSKIIEYMDDTKVITVDKATNIAPSGLIGYMTNLCKISVDDVVVTLNLGQGSGIVGEENDYVTITDEGFVDVYEPETAITTAPSTMQIIDSLEDFSKYTQSKSPATFVMKTKKIGGGLAIVNDNDENLVSIEQAFPMMKNMVMPAFYVDDVDTASLLAKTLKANNIGDTFIISSKPEVLKKAREGYHMMREVLDCKDITSEQLTTSELLNMMSETNASGGKIIILPMQLATKDNIRYFQSRFLSVFVKIDNNDAATIWDAVFSGANGIYSDYSLDIIKFMESKFPNSTGAVPVVTRPSYTIAHRGDHRNNPENSISGALAAIEAGADAIECDIYMSKDGVGYMNHDYTLDRTTNATGGKNAETMTIDEITSYKFREVKNGVVQSTISDEHVPTAMEFFSALKGKDILIVCELKTSNPTVVPEAKRIIEELGMQDQVVFISFFRDLMGYANALMPWSASGDLTLNGSTNDKNLIKNIETMMGVSRKYNCVPDGSQDSYSPKYVKAANHRGVGIFSWTYTVKTKYFKNFIAGQTGLTSDNPSWIADMITDVEISDERLATNENTLLFSKEENQPTTVEYASFTKLGVKEEGFANLVPITDDGVITEETNTFTKNEETYAAVSSLWKNGTYKYMMYSPAYKIMFEKEEVKYPLITVTGEGMEVSYEITQEVTSDKNFEIDADVDEVEITFENIPTAEIYLDPYFKTVSDGKIPVNQNYVTVYIKNPDCVYTITIRKPADDYTFKDVSSDNWFEKYVNALKPYGIVKGSDINEEEKTAYVKPEDEATRNEIAVFIIRMLGIEASKFEDCEMAFTDRLETDSWADNFVKAAYELGLIKGEDTEDGKVYRGNDNVSRGEFFAILARSQMLLDPEDESYLEADFDKFADKEDMIELDYFENEFKFIVYNKISQGDDEGKFNPGSDIKRSEIIASIARTMGLEK